MIAVRVLDRPDPRKAHTPDTPKGGGVGVVVAFLVGIAVLYQFAEFARLADPYFIGVIEASVAIAVVAFLDDLFDWKFTVKLAAQVLAALVAVGSGIYVVDYRLPYVGPLYVGWLGAPATVLWLLFATNAMNFIDGLNGLAGGVALIAACFLAVHRRDAAAAGSPISLRCCWPQGWLDSCRSISPARASSWATWAASSAASSWPCWPWWPAASMVSSYRS